LYIRNLTYGVPVLTPGGAVMALSGAIFPPLFLTLFVDLSNRADFGASLGAGVLASPPLQEQQTNAATERATQMIGSLVIFILERQVVERTVKAPQILRKVGDGSTRSAVGVSG